MPSIRNWVGRVDELQDLKAKIFNPEKRAIEITGAAFGVIGSPGIGKTMLAIRLINELHDEQAPFAACAWVSMRADVSTNKPPSFYSVTDSILFVLSNGKITTAQTAKDDFRKKTERIIAVLQEKPCLIAFDNVESVLQSKQAFNAGYFAHELKITHICLRALLRYSTRARLFS